ncbi:hypothetical protein OJAV_G00041440 [Oryzias javanicus]|uniref:Uncharacterized protein n=1 Tax=Oryzias javanicus TaxID=123683 RepID=A0A437DDB3_ORYJA|nr:hypothetical protein OJAV_G00041440 [Oryzias javanicus]
MFQGCSFQTNVYGTFKSHKNRKHSPYSLQDFKAGIVKTGEAEDSANDGTDHPANSVETNVDSEGNIEPETSEQDISKVFELKLGSLILKLENYFHVPRTAVDELLAELHYLIGSVSVPISNQVIVATFRNHNICVDELVIKDLTAALFSCNHLLKATGKDGPLATAHKRSKYYKENFDVIDPVEYVLESKTNRTFQYVPVLKTLKQLLKQKTILSKVVECHTDRHSVNGEYKCFQDGSHFKNNGFLSSEELILSLCVYIDDFEICNPLGTSRKKHKLCGVYWILGNLQSVSQSSLNSIYLALLCKSEDVKTFGYHKIFEPFLRDLTTLEQQGVFIDHLGTFIRGTVQCVVADNLGAHGLAGFVESFSGDYICRFCTATRSEIQSQEVKEGGFRLRSEELHQAHVASAREHSQACCGVKTTCVLAESLSFFEVTSGFPPDLAHDLLEGIVPIELAECFRVLIAKKYITFDGLNTLIQSFPYKWGDKTNRPHLLPRAFQRKKSIGGNAHENWCLLRLIPLIVGRLIPDNEPAWEVILDLKDIVELVVSPVHSNESIAYLENKISEHRCRYLTLFPENKLLPKHHYMEHYPAMILCFGPIVSFWTLRFESKHSYFKQVVRHTNCFKNITLSLATKHQLMMSYNIFSLSCDKSSLEVEQVSTVPLDVLNEEVANILCQKYPDLTVVHLALNVSVDGINYRRGMIIVHGFVGGLPEFAEIVQICVLRDGLWLIVKKLGSWYREHYRSFELDPSQRDLSVIELSQLPDRYPLSDYKIGTQRMVTLKRYVHSSE